MSHPDRKEVLDFARGASLEQMVATATTLRDSAKGDVVSYSPKVFIPLTRLCRMFATTAHPKTPRHLEDAFYRRHKSSRSHEPVKLPDAVRHCLPSVISPELCYRVAREALRSAQLRLDAGICKEHGRASFEGN